MRYYIKELNLQSSWNMDHLYKNTKSMKYILASDGIYQMQGDHLYKYKVQRNNSDEHCVVEEKNYIKEYTILLSGFQLLKMEKSYCIPYTHEIMDKNIEEYKIHPKSETKLVIERIDGKINDLFFESSYFLKDHSLKEDIVSLLSHLKL